MTPNGEFEVVAHEIGHSFGASHDCVSNCNCVGSGCLSCCPCQSRNSGCDCNGQFLMNPTSGSKSSEFSACTASQVCSVIAFRGPDCLKTPGSLSLFNGSICGNGVKEMDEECDCGTPEECAKDPCCLPNCKLKDGAVCSDANGACCKNCQIVKEKTMVCRSAKSECDRAETCDGISIDCPTDEKAPDGVSCNKTGAYCASGQCTNRDLQCKLLGKRINSNGACSESSIYSFFSLPPSSCTMSCSGREGCYPFQSFYMDGTDCAGGRCYSGECKTSKFVEFVFKILH